MSIKKFFGKMGIVSDDEEKQLEEEIAREKELQEQEEAEDEEEEDPVSNFERPSNGRQDPSRNVVDFTSAQTARDSANGNVKVKVVVIEPKSFDDSQQVANYLREKRPVVINFEKTDSAEARRIVDFISGTTYALNGVMRKVGHDVFFCAPANVSVTYTEDQKKVNTELPWLPK